MTDKEIMDNIFEHLKETCPNNNKFWQAVYFLEELWQKEEEFLDENFLD